MLRPAAPWAIGLLALMGLWTVAGVSGDPIGDAVLSRGMDIVRLLAAGLVVLNLRRAWNRATDDGQERLRWLLVGFSMLLASLALMIGGNVLVAVTGFPEPDIAWRPLLLDVGLTGFMTGMALSVLYTGAARPLDLVRRIASVAAVVTLGLFLAVGLEALFAGGIFGTYSLRTGVGSALAIATIVSTHRGLVRSIQRILPQS
jgi:hypothetical protein